MNRRYPDTSHVRLREIKSTFTAEGALCAATLYVPADASPDQALPAILMVGGWGSVQRALTSSFTHSFVEAGFAVMEFDYPGWGESGGFPRQGINPWRRTRVADTALAHLKAQPMVAAHRITLWGTSFGGGHVVDLASQHPEIKSAIIQVPMLDGLATTLATPPLRLLKMATLGLLDLLKPGRPIYIPTLAKPGEFGTMDRDEAWQAMEIALDAWKDRAYDNRVAARSVHTMPFYRPWLRLKDVKIPMLMIGATGDTVAPFVSDKVRRVGNPNVQVIEVDANHFDPYFDPLFPQMLAHQLAFLKQVEVSEEKPLAARIQRTG
ncbi:alpha/beta hydrolase [Aquabacterium sp. NJ1]|uniref:alpha/beta hydrolase n=1 Tax=Aquabacterium sp. NJ1 TaxID=1538295 RepID=UPI00068B829E|nr:alpha/beta hydrolase [Aquabacterium sp. NJ1]